MRYRQRIIGDEGLDIHVAVTEAGSSRVPRRGCAIGRRGHRSGRPPRAGGGRVPSTRRSSRGLLTQCVRCLEPATLALDVPVMLTFVEGDESTGEEDDEDGAEDVITFQDGVIDVGPEIRTNCCWPCHGGRCGREDCAAFVLTCGANRNLTPLPLRPPGGRWQACGLARVKL